MIGDCDSQSTGERKGQIPVVAISCQYKIKSGVTVRSVIDGLTHC